jgi:hypothetical protein
MDIKKQFIQFADDICGSDEGVVTWMFNNPSLLDSGLLAEALEDDVYEKMSQSILKVDTVGEVLSNKYSKVLLITLRRLFTSQVEDILGCVAIKAINGKISIYRGMTVDYLDKYFEYLKGGSDEYSHYNGLGNFWSYDRGKASSYFGSTGDTSILLEAEVPMDEVNLEETFHKWLNPVLGEAEAEIYLDSGVSVFLKKVVLTESGDEHQIERSLTV